MRARRYFPAFDSLDARLVLSDGGSAIIGGLGVGGCVQQALSTPNPVNVPTDPVDPLNIVTALNWYTDGSPPNPTYNPSSCNP